MIQILLAIILLLLIYSLVDYINIRQEEKKRLKELEYYIKAFKNKYDLH